MKLTKCSEFPSKNPDDGFTLMELLISLAIVSIIGVTMWMSFSTVVSLIRVIPDSVKLTQSFINLDTITRRLVSGIKPPYWEPHFEYELESGSVILPFFEGKPGKYLQFELRDSNFCIETFEESNMDEVQTLFQTGPFSFIEINVISTPEEGLVGVEFTLKPEHERIDEFRIFARFGGFNFEVEK